MDKNDCLVSILCTAYNHEQYIRSALESFVSQKTNFAFEVLVNDDASSDGTAAIIREYEEKYPEIIRPFYQVENQFSKGIGYIYENIFYPKARGKYFAFCEGDDYWTDESKLQRQADFLESHPDYSACVSISTRAALREMIVPGLMAVAVPLISGGMPKWRSAVVTALTGFPTILGALFGFTVGAMGPTALALSLSFASGAMLYVVFGELLPESILMWRSKLPATATIIGMLTGLIIIYM